MRTEVFDFVAIRSEAGQLPLRLECRNDVVRRLPGVTMMTLLAAIIIAPQIGLAAYIAISPEFREAIVAVPEVALELALALAICAAMISWPLRNALVALSRRRDVLIAHGRAHVTEVALFGTTTWSAPIAEFSGLAHHTRSSLSGVRQELVLAHPRAEKSIVVSASEQISELQAADMARLIGVPRVAAIAIYHRPLVWPGSTRSGSSTGNLAAIEA